MTKTSKQTRSLRQAMKRQFRADGGVFLRSSRDIGVSRQCLTKWIRGDAVPNAMWCERLARWLGIPLNQAYDMREHDVRLRKRRSQNGH